jgi:hypothetical protein
MNCQNNSEEKNNNIESITLPGLKLYCNAMLIRILWDWHKNRHIDQ